MLRDMALHEMLRPGPRARATTGVHVRAGVVAALPLVAGLAPFGFAVGNAVSASADPLVAWAGTLLIYSGSAQLALLQLLHSGTPVWGAILAAAFINVRLVVYSAALAPLWSGAPLRWKVLGAARIVDPTYAVAVQRRSSGQGSDGALAHYAGAAVAVTVGWISVVTLGAALGRIWA